MNTTQVIMVVTASVSGAAIIGTVNYVLKSIFKSIANNTEAIREANHKSEKGDGDIKVTIEEVKGQFRRDLDALSKDLRAEIESGYHRLEKEVENRRQGEISFHERLDRLKDKESRDKGKIQRTLGKLEATVKFLVKKA